jgi:hypothetical protein
MVSGNIVVGTRDGRLGIVKDGKYNELMNGHGTGETWGLALCKKTGYICTVGDDNKILTFDPKINKTIA